MPNGKYGIIYMHREILGLSSEDSLTGDHQDPSRTLDNTDENLRPATHREQMLNTRLRKTNTSGFKGVHPSPTPGKWVSQIRIAGKTLHLGTFDTREDAHEVRCVAAKKYHGKFARNK
jgi:hypothetical protein